MCRTAAEEEDLRNLVSGLKPAKIPELHRQLQAQQPVPAFEGLNTRDGYQCKLCNAARSSTESAQKHQQEHNQGQCMVPCLIQTLCKNGYVFVVRPPESDKYDHPVVLSSKTSSTNLFLVGLPLCVTSRLCEDRLVSVEVLGIVLE